MSINDKRSSYRSHICITIFVMLFIFVHSAMPGELSGAESNIIVQFIAGVTGWDEEVLSLFVRKTAHFTEFLILGICLSANMRDLREKNISDGALPILFPVQIVLDDVIVNGLFQPLRAHIAIQQKRPADGST